MINYEEISKMMDKNSKIPYPKVPDLYPNLRYAKMLRECITGGYGEFTAINQYIYEYINLSNNKELSTILRKISIDEMKHLEIVGEIIRKLNGNIHYIDSNDRQWIAKNINYNLENLKEMMEFNILSEEKAIMEYRKIMRYTNNMQLRRVFERIIMDENIHREIFIKIPEGMN